MCVYIYIYIHTHILKGSSLAILRADLSSSNQDIGKGQMGQH